MDGVDVVREVHDVLEQVRVFSEGVRSGKILGYTGKPLKNFLVVGIGGSYLGPAYIHEVFKVRE